MQHSLSRAKLQVQQALPSQSKHLHHEMHFGRRKSVVFFLLLIRTLSCLPVHQKLLSMPQDVESTQYAAGLLVNCGSHKGLEARIGSKAGAVNSSLVIFVLPMFV